MKWFGQAALTLVNKEWDWDSDSLKLTLHTSTYAINTDTHKYVSDLTNELGTAGGYTAGGLAIAGASKTYTAANSWGTSWAATTAYAVEDVVRPSTGNGFLYRAAVAGTSGGSAPTFPTTVGQTVTDGGVTWECVGSGILVLGLTDPNWTSPFTAGPFRYAILSDRTPGTAATQPLIGYIDFGSNQTGQGGAFTITEHATLRALHIFV